MEPYLSERPMRYQDHMTVKQWHAVTVANTEGNTCTVKSATKLSTNPYLLEV